jgi:mono/diheme cytochrome c family protein
MWKRVLVVFALLLAGSSTAAAQDQKPAPAAPPAEFKIPPEAAKQPNPVKLTPESLAKGKKIYGYDCAMCHGKDGDGKGDLASSLNAKMADFRDPSSLKDRTDGELLYVIKNGKGEMPAEGDRAKGNDGWDLVNYVRSFAKKESAEKDKQ